MEWYLGFGQNMSAQDSDSAMTANGSVDSKAWQSDKSVLECNRYMLEHQIATDVVFLVGPEGGCQEKVKAHRYVLLSRSPVFQAMLCGTEDHARSPDSEGSIRIPDADPIVFKAVLRYLYYEDTSLDASTALHVLSAAKKYRLTPLTKRCNQFLHSNINADNACTILSQSIESGEEALTTCAMDFIKANTKAVLDSADFKNNTHASLRMILKAERLKTEEMRIYKACIAWAKTQIRRKSISSAEEETIDDTDHKVSDRGLGSEIRKTLGDLLYLINFPLISLRDFSDEVSAASVLSYEEIISLFRFHSCSTKPSVPFPHSRLK